MLVVVDTNILVAGHLIDGAPALIVDLIDAGVLRVACTEPILDEYFRILSMPEFGFDIDGQIAPFLEQLEAEALVLNTPGTELGLADPSDEPFLAAALVSGAACLITSNTRHFPRRLCAGVDVILPGTFVRRYLPGIR
jgi:putative PIN family toxin of toxin-antitoxin system